MTDRPIIMSAPMVQAIMDGRKTMTRRLATSPLAKVEPGDRLWVRECFSYDSLDVDRDGSLPPWCWADGNPEYGDWTKPKPSIFMPRWASRLTLVVTEKRMERLQDISEDDAKAEGLLWRERASAGWHWRPFDIVEHRNGFNDWSYQTAVAAFEGLWDTLHAKPGTRWSDNPEIVVVAFTAHRCNIDEMGVS